MKSKSQETKQILNYRSILVILKKNFLSTERKKVPKSIKKVLHNHCCQPTRIKQENVCKALKQPKNHLVGPKKYHEKNQIDHQMGIDYFD